MSKVLSDTMQRLFPAKRGLLFAAALILLWGCSAELVFAGFGISPPYVRNERLSTGSVYTQEITIVRSDPVEDLNAELTLNLPGIESWFSFDREMQFLLPKGESQVKLNVTVRIPDDAKLGEYNGNIRIRTSSLNAPSTGVSLALGAQIDVRLAVVEEIFDFAVRRVELFEAEEGYTKWFLRFPGRIKFAMYIENTGNVPAAPARVTFEIYDVTGHQLLETTQNTNAIDRILPFATKKVYAYLPTQLPPGSYRVKYSIEKTETESAQKGELALSILPFGTITGYEKYGFEGLTLSQQLLVIVPAALLLFIVAMIFFWKGRRSKRAHPHVPPEDNRSGKAEPPKTSRSSSLHGRGGVVDLSRRK